MKVSKQAKQLNLFRATNENNAMNEKVAEDVFSLFWTEDFSRKDKPNQSTEKEL